MKISDRIKLPIAREMKEFEPFFKKELETDVPLLNLIVNYILRRKGKQMRPMLIFLSAKLNGEINRQTYTAATLIELLHTATLIHDDVVDETYQRRGFFSINALWRSKISVLVGDYLLSTGLSKALKEDQIDVLKIVSNAVTEMSEGELLQIEKSRYLNITEESYYDIIRKKTATLISACTESGAVSVNADKEDIAKMKEFGINLGIAFQIRDDILDYKKKGVTGKPAGNDIKEKKITLPLIHVLNEAKKRERRKIIKTISKHHKKERKIAPVIKYVVDNGGIDYARNKMHQFSEKALDILKSYPESDTQKALIELVDFTTKRES
ncbi:polyprenyl synthetase family protein [Marinilabiliaceae bacterium ANBcel2]|nr:polyprenyl synthetase family protein [Marinilabiliaceae bacterium ANBcel2]